MKLKEKMAIEAGKSIVGPFSGSMQFESEMNYYITGVQVGFLAGFEAAKKMAIHAVNHYDDIFKNYEGTRSTHGTILLSLGEQDVE